MTTTTIKALAEKQLDVLIIGGGINGVAIANLAAQSGLQVGLFEKGDFASGTSSRSTKLLHGGIRYLENFEFDLVAEALRERFIQWQSVPYLVKPLGFIIPIYRGDKRPAWMMRLGVWLYDLLSGKYRIGQHKVLSIDEVVGLVPSINREGLLGGVQYFDAQMDDARIVIENMLMAQLHGAHLFNYVEVVGFIKDKDNVVGVKVVDKRTSQKADIYAKTIIATVGPWADTLRGYEKPHQLPRLRSTKGVHLVYQEQISTQACLIQSQQDNRIFFVIPFHGGTLIGTTDTDFKGNPDEVMCDPEDISYLLTEATRVFPHIYFDPAKITHTFAGVRPLVFERGSPSKVSRKHIIEQSAAGVWYVMGGKYTTYRAIAEEVLIKAIASIKNKLPYSGQYPLYGSGAVNQELKLLRHRYGVSVETIRYLIGLYGSRFEEVLKLTLEHPHLKEPLCSCSLAIKAQVIYSRDIEKAFSADDIINRRLSLQYNPCPTGACREIIAKMLSDGIL